MRNWRKIAGEAKDVMTVCLAKVIDRALTEVAGVQWFAQFAEADAREKGNRITKPFQKTVYDLDLQGLLKFMRFRKQWAAAVLNFYGFYNGMDAFAAEGQNRQLDGLLERLINDFRNHIEAHSRAADIDSRLSGQPVERLYGHQEAYNDMVRLVRIFSKDPVGKTYYKRIVGLTSRKKPVIFITAAVLAVVVAVTAVLLIPKENVYYNDAAPALLAQQVTLQPVEVAYDGGALVAVCYVVNGTDARISDVQVYSLQLEVAGTVIAAADFGVLEGLELGAGETALWKFRFPDNTVTVPDADLEAVETVAFINYK